MRVFMLGWEFPPIVSGGLGTACLGLTRALSRGGIEVTFVLPRAVPATEVPEHVRLVGPADVRRPGLGAPTRPSPSGATPGSFLYQPEAARRDPAGFRGVEFHALPARLTSPYAGRAHTAPGDRWANLPRLRPPAGDTPPEASAALAGPSPYAGDLFVETQRYARLCLDLARQTEFDIIHVHDWMTFPAAMAVAGATGKPLVVHIHSTEIDRAGPSADQRIFDIERRGMHAAVRVIAVSYLTRNLLIQRYAVEPDDIDVVYNGIDPAVAARVPAGPEAAIRPTDKIVLFLGRITQQKGPEYFVAAARKVLDKYEKVKFVMAGAGDLVTDIIDLAAREGIGHRITFTGFLRDDDVARVFEMADVYVMPSVSEPFGIAALEAVQHDVPVIVSRTSGVSEVLRHVLKVDFWDVEDIADKILAVLRHPPLSRTMREFADIEARRLTWDDAASHCVDIYRSAIAMMP